MFLDLDTGQTLACSLALASFFVSTHIHVCTYELLTRNSEKERKEMGVKFSSHTPTVFEQTLPTQVWENIIRNTKLKNFFFQRLFEKDTRPKVSFLKHTHC